MPDQFSPAERSRIMRAVKSGDTTPEMIVRRLVHGLGYRYRLQCRDLPGQPDLVLPRLGKAIFVHGCFWHRHACEAGQSTPVSRLDYWNARAWLPCFFEGQTSSSFRATPIAEIR